MRKVTVPEGRSSIVGSRLSAVRCAARLSHVRCSGQVSETHTALAPEPRRRLAMPSSKILVEPDHVAMRQVVLTLVRVIPFLGSEVLAFDPPEAESRFLVKGDLSYAGVAGTDHRAAEPAGAQVGQHTGQHPPPQATIVLGWVDGDRS